MSVIQNIDSALSQFVEPSFPKFKYMWFIVGVSGSLLVKIHGDFVYPRFPKVI